MIMLSQNDSTKKTIHNNVELLLNIFSINHLIIKYQKIANFLAKDIQFTYHLRQTKCSKSTQLKS